LFTEQEPWLSHRQGHRAELSVATSIPPLAQPTALVDLEHSYPKPEEEEEGEEAVGGHQEPVETVQLLLYECGDCLQLFPSPKDFLDHQSSHLVAQERDESHQEGYQVAEGGYQVAEGV
ncbi:ZN574 protein, partial [Urocolius indicus]|nr:ZN574 protein [Urocolius indicus]